MIHLRLGDYLCYGNAPPVSRVAALLRNYTAPRQRAVVLYGNHKQNMCHEQSVQYLRDLQDRVEVSINAPPDEDFARMVNAKLFIQGRGGYSAMAAEVRALSGAPTISLPEFADHLMNSGHTKKDPHTENPVVRTCSHDVLSSMLGLVAIVGTAILIIGAYDAGCFLCHPSSQHDGATLWFCNL